jgi:hypothetical protein
VAPEGRVRLEEALPSSLIRRERRREEARRGRVIIGVDRKLKDSYKRLREEVATTGTGLLDLCGLGPIGAARVLGDARTRPVPIQGALRLLKTAPPPIDASSGQQVRHRLSRAGNRRTYPSSSCASSPRAR